MCLMGLEAWGHPGATTSVDLLTGRDSAQGPCGSTGRGGQGKELTKAANMVLEYIQS